MIAAIKNFDSAEVSVEDFSKLKVHQGTGKRLNCNQNFCFNFLRQYKKGFVNK